MAARRAHLLSPAAPRCGGPTVGRVRPVGPTAPGAFPRTRIAIRDDGAAGRPKAVTDGEVAGGTGSGTDRRVVTRTFTRLHGFERPRTAGCVVRPW